jgi:hypothetical protein
MVRILAAFVSGLFGLLLVLPVLIVAFPFQMIGRWVDLRSRGTEAGARAGESEPGLLIQFDPVLGWRPRPSLDAHYAVRRDDIYPIVTDEEGWPGSISLAESEMVVVGDSFAYGYGTRLGEAFWDRAPDLKIKPVGCPGYDLVQEVEALRSLGDRLTGKLVVWFIYLENDIPDCLRPHWRGYRKPFVRSSPATCEWEVISTHIRRERWRHSRIEDNMRTFAAVCGPGALAERYYGACEFLMKEAAEICQRVGADLRVASIPYVKQLDPRGRQLLASRRDDPASFDAGYPDQRLSGFCRRLEIPYYPMSAFLDRGDYKSMEGIHWNAGGHRKVAEFLRRLDRPRASPARPGEMRLVPRPVVGAEDGSQPRAGSWTLFETEA